MLCVVPVAASQLAPLARSDLGADVPAHTMVGRLGPLGLLLPRIRNPAGKISDDQPGQDSKLHRHLRSQPAQHLEELGAFFRGEQWNESGMRWNGSSSRIQTSVAGTSGGDLTRHALEAEEPGRCPKNSQIYVSLTRPKPAGPPWHLSVP